MYKVIIIEDEKDLAETLIKIINEVAPQCKVMGVAPSIKEAKLLIEETNPDIAFFDVELEDGLSFELLEKIPEINFEIIFVTAYSNYALNAFKYSAIDFVVKPIDCDDIKRATERAFKSLKDKDINQRIKNLLQNKNESTENQRIILPTSDSIHYVKIKEIVRCESDINYTSFHLLDGKKVLVSQTLGEYEKILPDFFFRAHRSHLINLKFITEFKKKTNIIHLSNNEKIPVSFRKKDALITALKRL